MEVIFLVKGLSLHLPPINNSLRFQALTDAPTDMQALMIHAHLIFLVCPNCK
jgi:hypothetical protein